MGDSLASLFAAARGLATIGFGLDVISVLIAILWFSAKDRVRLAVVAAGVLIAGATIAWLGQRGATTLDIGGRYDVLIARTLAELYATLLRFLG